MKTLFASLFAALFALTAVASQAAIPATGGAILADEDKTDGSKAPKPETEKQDEDDKDKDKDKKKD